MELLHEECGVFLVSLKGTSMMEQGTGIDEILAETIHHSLLLIH